MEIVLGKYLTITGTWMQKLQFLFEVIEWRPMPGGDEIQSKTSGFGAEPLPAKARPLQGHGGACLRAVDACNPAFLPDENFWDAFPPFLTDPQRAQLLTF